MKNSTPSKPPQLLLLNFLAKFLTERKYLMNTLIFVRQKYFQKQSSETNNKSPGNDSLTAEFYKHFSNELTPVLLDAYDFWGKLGTMGVTSRTGISMMFFTILYEKGDKKDIAKLQTHFNLDSKIYTTNS